MEEKLCVFQKFSEERILKKKKKKIYIYIYILDYRPASFYAKKTKRGWIFTHKEGRLDTFDRVVFLVEMGWCSNSRNAG